MSKCENYNEIIQEAIRFRVAYIQPYYAWQQLILQVA